MLCQKRISLFYKPDMKVKCLQEIFETNRLGSCAGFRGIIQYKFVHEFTSTIHRANQVGDQAPKRQNALRCLGYSGAYKK